MTDQTLARADALLTELVELVETARTLPMSSSCVVPRERMLDILDELRDVLPPEMDEARRLIAARDTVLQEAYDDAAATRETAGSAAELVLTESRQRAEDTIHDAEVRAYEIVEAGKAEHATLVSATGVHQAATAAAAELRAQAEAYLREVRDKADRYHDETISDAERFADDVRARAQAYAVKLTVDSEDYADRTLAELAASLEKAAATANQGRVALAARRAAARAAAEPSPEATELPPVAAAPAQPFDPLTDPLSAPGWSQTLSA